MGGLPPPGGMFGADAYLMEINKTQCLFSSSQGVREVRATSFLWSVSLSRPGAKPTIVQKWLAGAVQMFCQILAHGVSKLTEGSIEQFRLVGRLASKLIWTDLMDAVMVPKMHDAKLSRRDSS